MKKSVIALAIAAAVPAFAQAAGNVTLYGSIDTNIEMKDNGTTSRTNIGQSGLMTNRFGVKGTEDLGGGLKANFMIEQSYASDNPSTNNTVFGDRSAWVSTSGGFGEIRAGRDYTPFFRTICSADVMNGCTGAMTTQHIAVAVDARGGVRANNSIAYISPKMNGLSFSAMWSAGNENMTGNKSDSEYMSANVGYSAGKLTLGAATESTKAAVAGDLKRTVVMAGYDFGMGKVGAFHTRRDQNGNKGDATAITAAVKAGMGYAKVSFGQGDRAGVDYSLWGVGYEHPLSKRTSLYATYGVTGADNANDSKTMHLGVRHIF